MPTYTRKPYDVEARQWDGTPEGAEEILAWVFTDPIPDAKYLPGDAEGPPTLVIKLMNGGVIRAFKDDWIIREVWCYFEGWSPGAFQASFTEKEE